MRATLVLIALLAASVSASPSGLAYHDCDPDVPLGGTALYTDARSGKCFGAAVGLGSDFRCVRGVGATHAGPAWVAVLSSWGCQTGAFVVLP